ncbi:terpene synthase family protein [Kitasatospora sp. NPDC059327]|uniref:terpene synthase family protein n=1 Tax=Kitasatospora sp. NPDC059327 TaxID=3346803 RepID=UPI003684B5AC
MNQHTHRPTATTTAAAALWPKEGTPYRLRLNSRFVPVLHRDTANIERRANAWARPLLVAHFRSERAADAYLAQRTPFWAGMTFSHARHDRGYWAAVNAITWGVVDDAFARPEVRDDHARLDLLRHLFHQAIDGTPAPEGESAVRMAYEAVVGVAADMPPTMADRIRTTLHKAIDSSADQNRGPLLDTLTEEAYLAIRADDMWAVWIVIMTEYALAIDLGDELAHDPDLHQAAQLATDSIAYVNDLFSFNKEISMDEAFNLIWIYMRDGGLDLQSAIDKLIALQQSNEDEFVRLRDRVLAGPLGARTDIREYLSALEHIYPASPYFYSFSPRYRAHTRWDGIIPEHYIVEPIPSVFEIAKSDA